MKSLSAFQKIFISIVILTGGLLCFSVYAGKQAFAKDPELTAKLEKRYRVHVSGNNFYLGGNAVDFQDQWHLVIPSKRIYIKSFAGNIAIRPTTADQIQISASGKLNPNVQRLLYVEDAGEEVIVRETEGDPVKDLEIRIEVPVLFVKDLVIETISGGVMLENLKSDTLMVQTTSGDITLKQIRSKSLNVDTVSGELNAEQLAAGKMVVKSVSGDLTINNNHAVPSEITSVSGDIHLTIPRGENPDFVLQSVSGNIQNVFAASKQGKVRIEISSTSGDIQID